MVPGNSTRTYLTFQILLGGTHGFINENCGQRKADETCRRNCGTCRFTGLGLVLLTGVRFGHEADPYSKVMLLPLVCHVVSLTVSLCLDNSTEWSRHL